MTTESALTVLKQALRKKKLIYLDRSALLLLALPVCANHETYSKEESFRKTLGNFTDANKLRTISWLQTVGRLEIALNQRKIIKNEEMKALDDNIVEKLRKSAQLHWRSLNDFGHKTITANSQDESESIMTRSLSRSKTMYALDQELSNIREQVGRDYADVSMAKLRQIFSMLQDETLLMFGLTTEE